MEYVVQKNTRRTGRDAFLAGVFCFIDYSLNHLVHRYGSELCGGYRIFECDIDEITKLLDTEKFNLNKIDENIEQKLSQKKDYEKVTEGLRLRMNGLKDEIRSYSRQLAKALIDEEMFEELAQGAKNGLIRLEVKLKDTEDSKIDTEGVKRKAIKSGEILERILAKKEFINLDLSMLIDRIVVKEVDEVGDMVIRNLMLILSGMVLSIIEYRLY